MDDESGHDDKDELPRSVNALNRVAPGTFKGGKYN